MEGLSQAEAFARIRLLRSPNVGPVSYRQLLHRFGSAEAALAGLPDLVRRGGGSYKPASEERVAAEVQAVRAAGARYLFHDSPDYPLLLAELDGAPPILICQGDAALTQRPCVAIVGARNASAAAVKLARMFAGELAEAGYVVVSGLARGIDGAAHQASLSGGTIGVIASGIDIAYPPEHADLQEAVATQGLLLAEQPPGTEPLARHFPSRNRIIAGIAAGTLIVEAAPKSGSLITARLAGEAGREVMAVPGSPLDPRCRGANRLIKQGAVLIEGLDDVLQAMQGISAPTFDEPFADRFDARDADIPPALLRAVREALSPTPMRIEEIARAVDAPHRLVLAALAELELAGQAATHVGGTASRAV